MKNILILVDMQKGFAEHPHMQELSDKICKMLSKKPFDVVAATRFMNYDNSMYENMLGWRRLKTNEERELCNGLDSMVDVTFEKTIYTCVNPHFMQRICQLNDGEYPQKIFIAGVDTDCCVLKIATDLFESNIRPVVLTRYCDSNGGEGSHRAGILCLKRLIGEKQLTDAEVNGADDLKDL